MISFDCASLKGLEAHPEPESRYMVVVNISVYSGPLLIECDLCEGDARAFWVERRQDLWNARSGCH